MILEKATTAGTSFVFGYLGGAVALGAVANIFLGMVESPLLIRPCLKHLTRSELFITLTCGMATIAGTMAACRT